MSKSTKHCLRAVVLAALLAWPGVELYRVEVAQKQVSASIELNRIVTERLAFVKKTQVPAALPDTAPLLPTSNPAPSEPAGNPDS